MNRDEVQLLGFEIVAYAGDARSKLLEALNTVFKSSIFLNPTVRNHSLAACSPSSMYTLTAPDHVHNISVIKMQLLTYHIFI
jgi:hypothetical protein